MDFGATICKPASPLCNQCPFKKECFAFNHDLVDAFPLKKKKIIIKKRHFTYFLVNKGKKIAVAKREKKDIWRHLFEFYLLETNSNLPESQLIRLFCQENDMDESMFDIIKCSPVFTQQLTHQHISCRFIEMNIHQKMKNLNGFLWINRKDLCNFPFPRIINQYLESL